MKNFSKFARCSSDWLDEGALSATQLHPRKTASTLSVYEVGGGVKEVELRHRLWWECSKGVGWGVKGWRVKKAAGQECGREKGPHGWAGEVGGGVVKSGKGARR